MLTAFLFCVLLHKQKVKKNSFLGRDRKTNSRCSHQVSFSLQMEALTLLKPCGEQGRGKLEKVSSETTCKVHNGLSELGGLKSLQVSAVWSLATDKLPCWTALVWVRHVCQIYDRAAACGSWLSWIDTCETDQCEFNEVNLWCSDELKHHLNVNSYLLCLLHINDDSWFIWNIDQPH